MLGALATHPDASPAEQAEVAGVSVRKLTRIANLLTEASLAGDTVGVEDVRGRAEEYRALQRSRVDMVRGYAETRRCRRQFLLGYLGEDGRRAGTLRQLPLRDRRRGGRSGRHGAAGPLRGRAGRPPRQLRGRDGDERRG